MDLFKEEFKKCLSSAMSASQGGMDNSSLEAIMRAAHTIKSSSMVMGFAKLSLLCEKLESFIRDNGSEIDEAKSGLILRALQAIDALSLNAPGDDEIIDDGLIKELE